MENLLNKPLFAGSSDFAHNLENGQTANLKVLGYGIRLTKAGKAIAAFSLLPSGNLTTDDVAKVKRHCETNGIPVSGAKGCSLYQVTAYENTKTKEVFVNSFNPSVDAGKVVEVIAKPQKDAEGKEVTNASGVVYLRLELNKPVAPHNAMADAATEVKNP